MEESISLSDLLNRLLGGVAQTAPLTRQWEGLVEGWPEPQGTPCVHGVTDS